MHNWDKIVPTHAQSSWYDVPKTPTREKLDFWENTVFCYAVRWWKTENRKSRNRRKIPIRNGRDLLFFSMLLSRPFPYRETIFFILENASECSILCIFQNKKSTLTPKTFRQAKSTKSVPNYRNFFFTKKMFNNALHGNTLSEGWLRIQDGYSVQRDAPCATAGERDRRTKNQIHRIGQMPWTAVWEPVHKVVPTRSERTAQRAIQTPAAEPVPTVRHAKITLWLSASDRPENCYIRFLCSWGSSSRLWLIVTRKHKISAWKTRRCYSEKRRNNRLFRVVRHINSERLPGK